MSFEESLAGTAPGEPQHLEMTASNSSASSNVNGLSDRLVDSSLSTASSSQTSLLQPSSTLLDGVMLPPADDAPSPSGTSTPEVDPQILEALKSKDRLFVLKLGEQMEGLIRERHLRTKALVSPENSYQRLLVHRCAAYYKLTPESDPSSRCFSVQITVESRMPSRRISELVPNEQASHPQFKIMRRADQDRRRQKTSLSRAGSVAGEDADASDREPSEAGSMGGRSTASKKRSLAEREAAYLEARARIFHDLEEKAKSNERDTSASSSTLSLASASGSGSQSGGAGGSNGDDLDDDNVSTVPTESEWSVPATGDPRRTEANSAGPYSSRTSAYDSHSGSALASGRASPNSFNFPSITNSELSHPQPPYDASRYSVPPGYMSPYPVYYQPQGQPPVGYPYPYYTPYPYAPHLHPQHPQHASSDPSSPATVPVDGYSHQHPSQSVPYMHQAPYMWPTGPPLPGPQLPITDGHTPSPGPNSHLHMMPQGGTPQMQYPPQHLPPYIPPPGPGMPYGAYPPHQYYQPPPQGPTPIVHPHSQPIYPIELPPTNGPLSDHNVSSGASSSLSSGTNSPSPTLSRRSNGSHQGGNGYQYQNQFQSGNGHPRRGGGHPPSRGAWSYGPGIGMHHNVPPASVMNPGGEVVGPRLSSSMRRASGASSSSNGNRTPGDEVASTTSSSTNSSSSRRTYMSNVSAPSMHPLPARPDWAAGIKAQPTLHPPRSRHDSNNNSRNMSPTRAASGVQVQNQPQQSTPQQLTPIFLQPTDFPPLTSISATDKRPAVGGAWTNPKLTARSILAPNAGNANQGNALFSHGAGVAHGVLANPNRLEEDERGFERPPPKTNTELFNPKGGAKRGAVQSSPQAQSQQSPPSVTSSQSFNSRQLTDGNARGEDMARNEAVANAILVDGVSSLKLQTQSGATGSEREAAGSVRVGGCAEGVSHDSIGSPNMTVPAAEADTRAPS